MSDPHRGQAGASPRVRIRAGRPRDAAAVLAMLDDAVGWLVAQGRQGQWGAEPFSAKPDQVALVQRWAGGGGLWIAEVGGAPAGAMVLGPAPSYVPAVGEPELYVQLLVTARSHAGRGIGRLLLGMRGPKRPRAVRRCCGWTVGRAAGFTPTDRFTVDHWQGRVLEQRLQPPAAPSP